MKDGTKHVKIVEWSDADRRYVVSSPGLMRGGCQGDDELEVFVGVRRIVDEVIALYRKDGKALPALVGFAGRRVLSRRERLRLAQARSYLLDERGAWSTRPVARARLWPRTTRSRSPHERHEAIPKRTTGPDGDAR